MAVRGEDVEKIDGGITAPGGFRAAGIHCGIKEAKRDLALIVSDSLASAAGMFTTNAVKAAPVLVSQEKIQSGTAQAIVINSGNANACTGTRGLTDANEMARLAAQALGIAEEFVLVASTGVIGIPLPMAALRAGMPILSREVSRDGSDAAEAILTTDAFPKTTAVRIKLDGTTVTIGGMAKGAGMIHPRMATTLCFLTTDAAVAPAYLRAALRTTIKRSFNCISVDGDTSTNDSVFLLANGMAGNPPIIDEGQPFDRFQAALTEVATSLAQMVVRDGEGATKLVAITVTGARSAQDAKMAATAVMTSPLVKTAVHGAEPNWGRLMAAVGRSGAAVREDRIAISIAGIQVVRDGVAASVDLSGIAEAMRAPDFEIVIDLQLGQASYTGWTCDLTEAYVRLNAGYLS